jgi:hypothetical protein
MIAMLNEQAVAYLTARAVSISRAVAYGWYAASPMGVAAVLGFPVGSGGLAMVYPQHDGEPPLLRVRLFGAQASGERFKQPSGSTIRPFITRTAWAHRNDTTPIIIAEGECRALAAEEAGVAAIGLPGCWGWAQPRAQATGDYRRPRGPLHLHPDFERFAWQRAVYLAPDSDMRTQAMIELSFLRLAETLRRRGARVRMVLIPPHMDGSKQGLDDLLAREGPAAARWHCAHAPAATRDAIERELLRRDDHFVSIVHLTTQSFNATIISMNAAAREVLT